MKTVFFSQSVTTFPSVLCHCWFGEQRTSTGCPLFINIDFPWLFHDQKMNIHDLSAQHIFPSKRYTTYECIPQLVMTVPFARSTIVKKIKRFIIWLYKWSRVTFTELLSAVVKIPWQSSFSMTFPWPLLLSMTFQACKMVFLNSMTFQDQGAPCIQPAKNLTSAIAKGSSLETHGNWA